MYCNTLCFNVGQEVDRWQLFSETENVIRAQDTPVPLILNHRFEKLCPHLKNLFLQREQWDKINERVSDTKL